VTDTDKTRTILAGRRLLPREVARILYEAHWTDLHKLTVMIAITQQESEFYSEAVGPENEDGSHDLGIFQVNDSHAAEFKMDAVAFRSACFDPTAAARIARVLYVEAGYSFRPWVAFASGDYKKYLGTALIGVANYSAELHGLEPVPYVRQA
jgi:hypothetical protein